MSHDEIKKQDAGQGDGMPRVTLSAQDAAAVDAIVELRGVSLDGLLKAEMDVTPAAIDAARLARAQAWAGAIKSVPQPAASAGLLERTLAAVQQDRMKLPAGGAGSHAKEEARPRNMWSRRLGEFAAMAIAASILVAVVVPGINQARQSSRRVACAANLGQVASALSQYAVNGNGELPSIEMPADGNWLPRGPGYRPQQANAVGHSNAANTLPLVMAKYIPASRLLCAGRDVPETALIDLSTGDVPDDVRGYSYTNLYGASKPKWDGRHANIVMADRNPLFGSYVTDNVHANSFNHHGSGNYVVRADGTISWETSPDVGVAGDNIWTIGKENQRMYKGTETVALAGDTFLSP